MYHIILYHIKFSILSTELYYFISLQPVVEVLLHIRERMTKVNDVSS